MSDVQTAYKLKELINKTVEHDQGAVFKNNLRDSLASVNEIYDTSTTPFRSHLGASLIGMVCSRKLWFGFRWSVVERHNGKLIRLFNRGNMEEARFIALFKMLGANVFFKNENGQFRISDVFGHFGGSVDAVVTNLPYFNPTEPVLCEFKTSAAKPLDLIVKKGLREGNFQHFVQMQVYMHKLNIKRGVYVSINKNTEELYIEVVNVDSELATQFINRAENLIFSDNVPKKEYPMLTPGNYYCKNMCSYKNVCHLEAPPEKNCRTCEYSKPLKTATWGCFYNVPVRELNVTDQLAGCGHYSRKF